MDTGKEAGAALGVQELHVWNHSSFWGWLETNTGHVRAHDLETLFFQANEEKQWTWLFFPLVLFCFVS